jgi:hypothetical protein
VSRYDAPRPVPLPGWVYILTCPSFPGCCKIGGTGRTATHRAGELAGEYVTGQPFAVLYRVPVSDWPAVEAAAHRMLSDCRVPRSELFRCTPRQARAVVKAAARAHARPWLGWLSPRPRRSAQRRWNRYRRGENWPALALLLAMPLAVLVMWLKPPVPSWLPMPAAHVVAILERVKQHP